MTKYILILLASLFALPTLAAQKTIQGTYLSMDYQFSMNDEYQDVLGSWGKAKYKLEWDDYRKILKGETAIEDEYFEYDDFNKKAYLTVRCGYGELDVLHTEGYQVKGFMCQTPIDQHFASEDDALEFIRQRSVVEIVTEFPDPARDEVAKFLLTIMILK